MMFPSGPADDEIPSAALGALTPAQPVLPSRATGEAKPLTPLPQAADPEPAQPRKRQTPPKHSRGKRPPAKTVIKATRKPRRKTVAKKARKTATKREAPAASRNRPLEAKNRLHAVMTAVAGMSKGETTAFMGAMSMLEDMPRGARQRVIGALSQVYA